MDARTIKALLTRRNLQANNAVYTVDLGQSEQAQEKVLETYYKDFDAIVRMVHAMDPENCKAAKLAEVEARQKYNMAELGPYSGAHIAKLISQLEKGCSMPSQREFTNRRSGDKQVKLHVSVALSTRADGVFARPDVGVEGAPPFWW